MAVYFIHRTLFHRLATKIIVGHLTGKLDLQVSAEELDFARWERRGAAEHTAEKSAQSVLDETNAAIHFFYCSAWSAILFALILRFDFPNNFRPSLASWIVVAVVVIGLLIAAFFGDSRTAMLGL